MPASASPKEKCIERRNDLKRADFAEGSHAKTRGSCRATRTGKDEERSNAVLAGTAGSLAKLIGKTWAVRMATEKKVSTAEMDLRENLDMPQSI